MATSQQTGVVLVVEDEPFVRMVAVDTVQDAGYEAVEASTADDAIRILETREDIRIVFTDIHMPGSMDGLKLARAISGQLFAFLPYVGSDFLGFNA